MCICVCVCVHMRVCMHVCMCVLPASVLCLHGVPSVRGVQKGYRIPGTGVMGHSCDLLCGCLELNPGFLEEQPVL